MLCTFESFSGRSKGFVNFLFVRCVEDDFSIVVIDPNLASFGPADFLTFVGGIEGTDNVVNLEFEEARVVVVPITWGDGLVVGVEGPIPGILK